MDLYTVRHDLAIGKPLSSIKLRVTDYSRVSTDHLEQKKSLKNQIEHFDEFIKSNENWTYVNGYVDDGISGTSDIKRDNFMRMIADAKEGKFDLIVTKEISRFSRNTLDSIKYTRELLSYGVAVLFVSDNINTVLPDSELRLTIMASMAQDEIRRLSERVKFGMKRAITNGEVLGNNMLYGYNKNKITGNLEIIDTEAELIKRLYNMYAVEKDSLSKIAKTFNDEGLKTCQNKKWCTSTLSRMIANPKYKGYYCGKKTEITDYMTKKIKYFKEDDWVMYEDKIKIPPIIDEDLWERANKRLKSRKKRFGEDFKDKEMYKNRYPLSAKIYCSEGNNIYHRRKQVKATDDITWVCSNYLKHGKSVCDSPNIRESEINDIFDDITSEFSINLNNISSILQDLYKNNKAEVSFEENINKYNKEKEKIIEKKERLLELNIEGSLSNNEFCERNNKCNEEIEKLDNKIQELENKRDSFDKVDNKNKKLLSILSTKINSKNIKDRLMELLLEKIVVSKINNDKNNIELNIFLNFFSDCVKENRGSVTTEEGFTSILRKEYSFKRGYETKSTKRYTVKYQINCQICH